MQNIEKFLIQKRNQYEKRAEKMNKQIEMFRRCYETNEKAHGKINGYTNAIIPDINARDQYNSAISKQNELYAVVNFIEELQKKYFSELNK